MFLFDLKNYFFIAVFAIFLVKINCWDDKQENEEFDKLVQSFNKSINVQSILNKIDKKFNEIVEIEIGELSGHAEPELKQNIYSFIKFMNENQLKLNDFHKKFKSLEDKFMLKSVQKKINCIKIENEIFSLNESIYMVIDQLKPYQIENFAIPNGKYDSNILKEKLFKFKEEYPSYNEMDFIQREIYVLNINIQKFLNKTIQKSDLIDSFRESFKYSNVISQKLKDIRKKTFEEAKIHSKHIPVKLDYDLLYLIQMHKSVWDLKEMYLNKINIDTSLNSSIKFKNVSFSMIIVISFLIIQNFF